MCVCVCVCLHGMFFLRFSPTACGVTYTVKMLVFVCFQKFQNSLQITED